MKFPSLSFFAIVQYYHKCDNTEYKRVVDMSILKFIEYQLIKVSQYSPTALNINLCITVITDCKNWCDVI